MPPYPTVTMRNGDRGDHVRQLQALLNRDYPAYSKLTEDGEFGPKTEAVIREFQRRAGLSVTGVADSWTLQKLDELTVQYGGRRRMAAPARRNAVTGYTSVPAPRASSPTMCVRSTLPYRVTRWRSVSTARSQIRPTPWPASGLTTGLRAGAGTTRKSRSTSASASSTPWSQSIRRFHNAFQLAGMELAAGGLAGQRGPRVSRHGYPQNVLGGLAGNDQRRAVAVQPEGIERPVA